MNGTITLHKVGTPSSPNFTNGILRNNNGDSIDVGSSSIPFFIDIDDDLDLDLVIGGFNGRLSFYDNTGSTASHQFTLNSSYFGSLDVGDNSTPFMIDYNKDGAYDLFSGNRNGEFFYFRNDGSNTDPVWTEVTRSIHSDDTFGGNTFPCFIDIDNDTDLDLFLGNVKGGLYLYNNSEITNVVDWGLEPVFNYN